MTRLSLLAPRSWLAGLGVAITLGAACGSEDPSPRRDAGMIASADAALDAGQADSGSAPDATGPDAAPGAPDAQAADAALGTVDPPTLASVQVVQHGTMQLDWTNPASGCTTITINRKKDAGSYAVAQTVTGRAIQATDMPGHANGTYCYTLVCTLGGVASAPSNHRCATQ